MLEFLNEFKSKDEVRSYFEMRISQSEYFKSKMDKYEKQKQKEELLEARRHISVDPQQRKFKHKKNVTGLKRKQTAKDLVKKPTVDGEIKGSQDVLVR